MKLRAAYDSEIAAARAALASGDAARAFAHYERAHVLGQRRTVLHVRAHVGMLRVALARRDAKEALAQLPRIVAAAIFSRIWVPAGNTGGANVSAFRPMPVPPDLAEVLAEEERRVG